MKVRRTRTLSLDILNDIVDYVIDDLQHNRVDCIEDSINNNMDSVLIYYDDQWDVMKAYQTPQEANFSEAWQMAWEDIYSAIEVEDEWFDEDDEEE